LLLAAYPWGRDSTEMPKRISPGVVAGIEATKVSATPRFYYGIVVDFWGLGATLGGFEERASTFDNPNGSVLPAGAARPDNIWLPGVFVAVTTDLDIFQAAFQKYLNAPQFPTLAGSN
jgi:hypothetical protein